jgi:hypothetical protein
VTSHDQPYENRDARTRGPSILDAAPRESWWRRWLQRLFGQSAPPVHPNPPVELPPPPPPVEVRKTRTHNLLSPARGDAFDFVVGLHCEWTATGHGIGQEPQLEQLIDLRHQQLLPEMESTVRGLTRRWDLHQCAEAELDLSTMLANRWQRLGDETAGAAVLGCHVRAQVGLDSSVRDLRRHAWLLKEQSSSRQQAIEREVGLLKERFQLWRGLIDEVSTTSDDQDAIRLALRPGDQEAVLIKPGQLTSGSSDGHEPYERSREHERELFQLAFKAYDAHRQNDTADALWDADNQVGKLLGYLGITGAVTVAPPDDGRPLDDGDDSERQ